MSIWNTHPKLVDRLVELDGRGFSAGDIARALGHGITRNAVLSKRDRLRKTKALPKRLPSTVKKQTLPKSFMPSMPKIKADKYKPKVHDGEPVFIGPSDGEFPDSRGCLYPKGESVPFHFCGHPRKDGVPYCDFHASICLSPAKVPKAERDAKVREMDKNSGLGRCFG